MEDIKVSVYCLAYNHEKYIRKTLEGFVSQKTNFKYEVFVHDDASTDKTADIIREYELKYPDIIKPIYQTENQYSKGVKISQTYIYPLMSGKYVATCEGDDYWIDANKLQKQFDFLEKNKDYSLVLHNGYKLDNITKKKGLINPYKRTGELSLQDVFIEPNGLPPTASMFFRKDLRDEYPYDVLYAPVGDRPLRMYLATKGKVYYMNECMCVYRVNNKDSFGGRLKCNKEKSELLLEQMKDFFYRFDRYYEYNYHQIILVLISREELTYLYNTEQYKLAFSNYYFKKYESIGQKIKTLVKSMFPKLYKTLKKVLKEHNKT